MTLLLLLAFLQGLTEFLPISSSAHLILVPHLFGYESHPFAWDIAAHTGSLLAVVIYYRKTLINMLIAVCKKPAKGWNHDLDAHLAVWIVIATLPVVVVGAIFHGFIAEVRENLWLMAFSTVAFGILLGFADRTQGKKGTEQLTWLSALAVGFCQAMALIPGVSRSGIVITALLFFGVRRIDAAKITMLLGIPTIFAATALMGKKLFENGVDASLSSCFLMVLLSFVTTSLAIHWLLKWLDRHNFSPFVIYRLFLGGVLIWFAAN